jgi:TPR repeat protein
MFKKILLFLSLLFFLLACASSSAFADVPGGQAAILKGDFPRAFKEFKEEADKGNPLAMAPVAVMLHFGQGVKRDLKQAFSWYRKAAVKGYEAGMANVGIMYYKGAGTKQDDVKAYAWLDLASYVRGGREHNAKAHVASFLSPKQLEKAKQLAISLRKKYSKK